MTDKQAYDKLYYIKTKAKRQQRNKDNVVEIKAKRAQHYQENKEVISKDRKLYYINNKEKIRIRLEAYYYNKAIQVKYGINIDDYIIMLENQNYKCKICNIPQDNLKKRLNIDHCHLTGKVRGLLCHNCNLALGFLNDDLILLDKAKQYLIDNEEL